MAKQRELSEMVCGGQDTSNDTILAGDSTQPAAAALPSTSSSSDATGASGFGTGARLKVLVVPVHPITRQAFDDFTSRLRQFSRISLRDVPPDPRGSRAVFSSAHQHQQQAQGASTPTSKSNTSTSSNGASSATTGAGELIIDFVTPTDWASSQPLAFLGDLQAHRRVHALVGLVDAREFAQHGEEAMERALRDFKAHALAELPRTFAHKVYALEPSDEQLSRSSSSTTTSAPSSNGNADGLVIVPRTGDVSFFLHSLVADLAGEILWEFSTLAAELESRVSIPTPQEPLAAGAAAPETPAKTAPSRTSSPAVRDVRSPTPPPATPTASTSTVALNQSPTSASHSTGVIDSRSRRRVAGRERKLMADMWLLSGRVQRAIETYNEAIMLTRAWADGVWQASALEGLATALIVQAALARAPPPAPLLPGAAESQPAHAQADASRGVSDAQALLSSVPDKFAQATALYERMLPSSQQDAGQTAADPDRAHAFVHADACLRCAHFLMAIWHAGGSVERALERLVYPATAPPAPPVHEQRRAAGLRALEPANGVSRASIAQWVSSAYTPALSRARTPVRLRILSDMAALYASLGYTRKHAFVIREIAAICSAIGGSPRAMTDVSDLVRRRGGAMDRSGNQTIIKLVERVCEIYGVPASRGSTASGEAVLQGQLEAQTRFGWPLLQVGVLKDAVAISELLPDYEAAIRFTVTTLRTLAEHIAPDEQLELSRTIPKLFAGALRRGVAFELDYWGPSHVLVSLELAPLTPGRVPHEHVVKGDAAAKVKDLRNPFIYNPNAAKTAKRNNVLLVQNEVVEVWVTLQNPFLFELSVEAIELSTTGVPFAADRITAVVPPGSLHTVRLTGVPREPGRLTICGCNIRLAGCAMQEFFLPVADEPDESQKRKSSSGVVSDPSRDRVKRTGLDFLADKHRDDGAFERGDLKFLEATVTREMPLLWLRATSLEHGALMLYDGELSTMRLTVENMSTTRVDFVELSFEDSHTAAALSQLAGSELPTHEVYELEVDNAARPVFEWLRPQRVSIEPGETVTYDVRCRGKVGCTSGTVHVAYGTTGDERLYSRRLRYDIFMTVHASLLPRDLDLVSLKAFTAPREEDRRRRGHMRSASVASVGQRVAALDGELVDGLTRDTSGSNCLVAIDVMNVYGQPFEVTCELVAEQRCKVRQRIEPGATARVLIPVPRINLAADVASQLIPSGVEDPTAPLQQGARQFVVSKSRMSSADEAKMRELFWYREELLKRIRMRWHEVGSLRRGEVSLRGLRLTEPMLRTLRADDVKLSVTLEAHEDEQGALKQIADASYVAELDGFLEATVHITNLRTEEPLEGAMVALKVEPAVLSDFVAIDGLEEQPLPVGKDGVTFPLSFLSCGKFALMASLRDKHRQYESWPLCRVQVEHSVE